ncbi:barstar family protein [Thermomonas flagellata]|uniref:barstar family protein n=1 Tax=Thermomonas flagellata TaxID=2888524 RepID=UPI001F03B766|nr:barstar family protein [Thermomonas flagellata]
MKTAALDRLDLADPEQAGVYFVTDADLRGLARAGHAGGLQVVLLDLHGVRGKPQLLERLAGALQFPDPERGRNWDALSDRLRDLSWLPASGYLLLIADARALREADAPAFDTFLDILDEAAADWAAAGTPFWAFLALPEEEFGADA